jgi:hypothetical protein
VLNGVFSACLKKSLQVNGNIQLAPRSIVNVAPIAGSYADPAQFDDDDTQDQKRCRTDGDRSEGTTSNISVSCRPWITVSSFGRAHIGFCQFHVQLHIPRRPFSAQSLAPSPTCRQETGSQNPTAEIVTPR